MPFRPVSARGAAAVLVAAWLAGCGHGGSSPSCRAMPVEMTVDDPAAVAGYPGTPLPVTVRCAFDGPTATQTCTAAWVDGGGGPHRQARTRVYPSVAAFVDEGASPGATRALVDRLASADPADPETGPMRLIPDRPVQGAIGYDADGRVATIDALRVVERDAAGRPLRAVAPTPLCTGDPGWRWTWDDARREARLAFATRTLTPSPDGTVPCIARTTTWTFDADGHVAAVDGVAWKTVASTRVCAP